MSKQLSLRAQLAHFETTGRFPSSDGDDQFFGFYDWFCKDTSLERKSKSLVAKLKKFLKVNPTLDLDKHYAFFKNNCPYGGPLYDDFRICDAEQQTVRYTVVPKCGHSGKAEIWGHGPEGFGCLGSKDTYKELVGS
jgi:hypothetical protein